MPPTAVINFVGLELMHDALQLRASESATVTLLGIYDRFEREYQKQAPYLPDKSCCSTYVRLAMPI